MKEYVQDGARQKAAMCRQYCVVQCGVIRKEEKADLADRPSRLTGSWCIEWHPAQEHFKFKAACMGGVRGGDDTLQYLSDVLKNVT